MRATRTAALFLLVSLSTTFASFATQEQQSGGTIQGVVTREGTNDPIADARITVVARGSLAATGFSAQQIIQASNRGAAVSPELVQLAQTATRGGPGAALANAVPLTAVTDSAGKFTISNVPPGEHFVRAQLQGYFGALVNGLAPPVASASATVVAQQTAQVRLSLLPGGAISGQITDATGKPLLNTVVQIVQPSYQNGVRTLQPVDRQPTNDRGEFRISLLPPGEYFVAAVQRFYPGVTDPDKAIPIVLKGGEEKSGTNIQLQTLPTAKISGRVVNALPPATAGRGAPRAAIASIALAKRDAKGLPGVLGGAAVNANEETGAFEFANVTPGSYDLFARLPINYGWGGLAPPERATAPWAIGRVNVDVNGTNVEGVTITVRQGLDVKGQLLVDGKPASTNLRISISPDDSATRINDQQGSQLFDQISRYPVQVQQDGSFAIPVIPEGHYRFQISALSPNFYVEDIRQGSTSIYDNGLTVGGDKLNPVDVVINSNGGTVEGTLYGADRKPLPNTMVVLVPPANRRQNPALYKTTGSDAQGHFVMTAVAPGSYKLFAWESVLIGAYQNAEFLRKYEERGANVTVRAGASVRSDVSLIRD
jgi:hypothetical protein